MEFQVQSFVIFYLLVVLPHTWADGSVPTSQGLILFTPKAAKILFYKQSTVVRLKCSMYVGLYTVHAVEYAIVCTILKVAISSFLLT